MLEKEEMKVGLLIWWSAERDYKAWNCPAVITEINDDSFKVRTLDNFKETGDLLMDDDPRGIKSSRGEMRLCTPDEVAKYFTGRLSNFKQEIESRHNALADLRTDMSIYKQKSKDFLAQIA